MQGLMMNRPLRIADLLTFAADTHPEGEIVSVRTEGDIHRETYPEAAGRVARLANALVRLGIAPGDRVATLAWNGYRHFELYYAISGIGAVCHTINPRLAAAQMTYIIRHAADRIVFVDLTFIPILERLLPDLPAELRFVVMTDAAHMPATTLPDALCYEDLIGGEPDSFDWPTFPEDHAAALCYTSGTTGEPKGALYTHRSTVLHAMVTSISMPKTLQEGNRILPVVPLFHVNAWGLPYSAPLTGASLVFPGGALDGASLFDLMDRENVYSAWGVPTVWLGILNEIDARGRIPNGFRDVLIGGSAAPTPMIARFEAHGVNVTHAWGMTEMSPIGTQGSMPPSATRLAPDALCAEKAKQGRRLFGVEMKLADGDGRRLPHDGAAVGELFVRGNTVISGYHDNVDASAAAFDTDGWLATGDVASISANGFVQITDRAKDLIKSGGEWISSLDLENVVLAHPKVANCAVVAVPHPRWDERPLLVVVPRGEPPLKDELIGLLAGRFARWQLPDDVVFVDALPLTATGKVSKLTLRRQFADHALPGTEPAHGSA